MGHKVRMTLNIDASKLKRVQDYLGLDTETEVIDLLLDRLLDEGEFERELAELNREFATVLKGFRSPFARG